MENVIGMIVGHFMIVFAFRRRPNRITMTKNYLKKNLRQLDYLVCSLIPFFVCYRSAYGEL